MQLVKYQHMKLLEWHNLKGNIFLFKFFLVNSVINISKYIFELKFQYSYLNIQYWRLNNLNSEYIQVFVMHWTAVNIYRCINTHKKE